MVSYGYNKILLPLIFLLSGNYFASSAQKRAIAVYNDPRPTFFNADSVIKKNGYTMERIFRYKKQEKNKDSTLVCSRYFDSLGACIKQEDFGDENIYPRSITSYTYLQGLLIRMDIYSGAQYFDHELTTYDYDSIGNCINESTYFHDITDTARKLSLSSQKQYIYDDKNRVIKEFSKNGVADLYLHYTYDYNTFGIDVKRAYDINGKWMYSYKYYYEPGVQKEFLENTKEVLQSEHYFNGNRQIIKIAYYMPVQYVYDYNWSSCNYANNLITLEITESKDGAKTYFKHYYYDIAD
jgi:hypothetical protein